MFFQACCCAVLYCSLCYLLLCSAVSSSVLWQTEGDYKTYRHCSICMLTLFNVLGFITPSVRERERVRKWRWYKEYKETLRVRQSYMRNHIQAEGKTDRGLDGRCLRVGGSWLFKAADYKNSHHIACPHLHRCSVSAIPVLGFVGN